MERATVSRHVDRLWAENTLPTSAHLRRDANDQARFIWPPESFAREKKKASVQTITRFLALYTIETPETAAVEDDLIQRDPYSYGRSLSDHHASQDGQHNQVGDFRPDTLLNPMAKARPGSKTRTRLNSPKSLRWTSIRKKVMRLPRALNSRPALWPGRAKRCGAFEPRARGRRSAPSAGR
jgi:hypothetical protein